MCCFPLLHLLTRLLGLCRVEGLQISKSTNLNALLFFIAFLTSHRSNRITGTIGLHYWVNSAQQQHSSSTAAAQQHIDL
jgi:hypothetical protein